MRWHRGSRGWRRGAWPCGDCWCLRVGGCRRNETSIRHVSRCGQRLQSRSVSTVLTPNASHQAKCDKSKDHNHDSRKSDKQAERTHQSDFLASPSCESCLGAGRCFYTSAILLASPVEHDSEEYGLVERDSVGNETVERDPVGYVGGGALLPSFAAEVASCPMLRFLECGMESSRRMRADGGKGNAIAQLF